MSETAFPINDLLRRKFHTSIVILSITLSVAATTYLLLFGENIGFEISSMIEGKLTAGFSIIYSPFLLFVGALIVVTGAVIVSFMIFVMMSQRTRDIGLMKATGCPNNLIFGYFMTELLTVTLTSYVLGLLLGILMNHASVSLFKYSGFQISPKPINLLLILILFFLFLVLTLIFGAKPILNATKIEPAKAISAARQFGLSKEPGFKVTSKSSLTTRIALRSLFRRKSATIRIILCLSTVVILVTIGVAGAIIAEETSKSWVEKAMGRDIVLIGHKEICDRYRLLYSKFWETEEDLWFNYAKLDYLIEEDLLNQLNAISGMHIDLRLALEAHVKEVEGYIFDPEESAFISVGDDREGESLIIGVEPEDVLGEWFMEGRFLEGVETWEAVIGDSLGQKIFSMPLNQKIYLFDRFFSIAGVCLDPINNGNVTYVPLDALQNVSGIAGSNLVIAKVESTNRSEVLSLVSTVVQNENSEFEVLELNELLDKNLSFLGHIWSTLMFIPMFSLISASLCLVGYVLITIAEQRQELGVLKALGVKPKTIVRIVTEQSLTVLLSSCAAGIPLGIIVTLMILVPEPVVTIYTILEITMWLFIALLIMFVSSLCPAVVFARKSALEMMNDPSAS